MHDYIIMFEGSDEDFNTKTAELNIVFKKGFAFNSLTMYTAQITDVQAQQLRNVGCVVAQDVPMRYA